MSKSPNKGYDFSVGPSTLHPLVGEWMQDFFQKGWGALNHRSIPFMKMYERVVANLKVLLELDSDFMVFISDSGSTIMERQLLGLVHAQSFHFVMGSFGQKQKNFAQRLGLDAQSAEVASGESFDQVSSTIYPSTELICATHCETSTGVQLSNAWITALRRQYPDTPISLDMVSSAPFVDLDLNDIDSFYFSCQKCFGLPAGIGIWCITEDLAHHGANDINAGAHQRLSEYISNYERAQTVSTPNVLGVFLLDCVLQDYLVVGRQNIRARLGQRKTQLIDAIERSPFVKNHVKNIKDQSDAIFVADVIEPSNELYKILSEYKLIVSEGYGQNPNPQIRIGNFVAIPDEGILTLCKALQGY